MEGQSFPAPGMPRSAASLQKDGRGFRGHGRIHTNRIETLTEPQLLTSQRGIR